MRVRLTGRGLRRPARAAPGARFARRPLAGAPPRGPGLCPLRGPGPAGRIPKRSPLRGQNPSRVLTPDNCIQKRPPLRAAAFLRQNRATYTKNGRFFVFACKKPQNAWKIHAFCQNRAAFAHVGSAATRVEPSACVPMGSNCNLRVLARRLPEIPKDPVEGP